MNDEYIYFQKKKERKQYRFIAPLYLSRNYKSNNNESNFPNEKKKKKITPTHREIEIYLFVESNGERGKREQQRSKVDEDARNETRGMEEESDAPIVEVTRLSGML